ncbi:uncharacterized protein E0L32_008867 [Thyridium curvatum]|uniref:Peptidase A1 domain-containing protein n=1 Tax=Thyridium curvatum TaxID=1093900 RepID=A0A507AIA2_9PEZI|nr:uncharacterized protein E0L32_008867 [Thyridium curvatum]TPX09845.1 hypothetical protein E0L32_008867 [Thyridium curvatum]
MKFSKAFLAVSLASVALTNQVGSSNVLPIRRRQLQSRAGSSVIPLKAADFGTIFDVEVSFGDQKFLLIPDTGSSDIWVVGTGFECFDSNQTVLPQSSCRFANTYNKSATFHEIHNETFGAGYGTGIALGLLGYEDIALGGVTVRQQTVGVVNMTTDTGDTINSGILGLGYPILTSAHAVGALDITNPLANRTNYDPLLYSMHKQGLIEPWFSIALNRLPRNTTIGDGGYLGLGELPPVPHSDIVVTAPVEVTEAIPIALTNGVRQITEWTLAVDSVLWGGASNSSPAANSTRFQAVVDTGSPFNYLPPEIVDPIHALFSPPATMDAATGVAPTPCDAKVPKLGVTIRGQTFWHLDQDLILQTPDGSCISALKYTAQGYGSGLNFLGDPFLKNVVSVFDFGKDEMRFMARQDGGGVSTAGATNRSSPGGGSSSSSNTSDGLTVQPLMEAVAAFSLFVAALAYAV